jgi:hypothetical protein
MLCEVGPVKFTVGQLVVTSRGGQEVLKVGLEDASSSSSFQS